MASPMGEAVLLSIELELLSDSRRSYVIASGVKPAQFSFGTD